jgi:hypothetical protein
LKLLLLYFHLALLGEAAGAAAAARAVNGEGARQESVNLKGPRRGYETIGTDLLLGCRLMLDNLQCFNL